MRMNKFKIENDATPLPCGPTDFSRREFLMKSGLLAAATAAVPGCASFEGTKGEMIIDIHQHVGYSRKNTDALLEHQRVMGVSKTILLPAGRNVNSPATHEGVSNGLEAKCLGNEDCLQLAKAHLRNYRFGANEVPDLADAVEVIEKYLNRGAVVIAEQKFGVECDSPGMQRIYELAAHYHVPVLMHWQYKRFNYGFDRFYKMLEKYPRTTFIGHAQTFWAHIDKNYKDDTANLYPKGKVTPGGLTDRYLRDYPNMYGDLSAGSGLNAFKRDEEHGRNFFVRHQDKLIYGSDCNDSVGFGEKCQGAQMIAEIRKLVPTAKIRQKLFSGNAKKVFTI
jgi:predicted TIM-barrel fold metal-dependent hydrolase